MVKMSAIGGSQMQRRFPSRLALVPPTHVYIHIAHRHVSRHIPCGSVLDCIWCTSNALKLFPQRVPTLEGINDLPNKQRLNIRWKSQNPACVTTAQVMYYPPAAGEPVTHPHIRIAPMRDEHIKKLVKGVRASAYARPRRHQPGHTRQPQSAGIGTHSSNVTHVADARTREAPHGMLHLFMLCLVLCQM